MPQNPRSPIKQLPVPVELIERRIYLIRGQRVMFDNDLSELYQVPTKALNQAVRRNLDRFPEDFMFRLSGEECDAFPETSRSPLSTLCIHRARRGHALICPPQQTCGADDIVIIRAFLKLRQILASHTALARRIEKLEATQKDHAAMLSIVVNDIETLSKNVAKEFKRLKSPRRPKPRIGFVR